MAPSVPGSALLRRLSEILKDSRRLEADLVAHIAEVDARELYRREAVPSIFVYCTDRLHLSEQEAYLHIAAARASREHPVLLAMLRDGRLHLSGIGKLAPHLTPENRDEPLKQATHKSERQIEEMIAALVPRPEARPVIRRLPRPSGAGVAQTRGVLGPDRVDSSDTAPSAGVLSEDKRDAGGESCRPGTLHKAVGSSHPITRPARGVLRVTPGRGAKRNAP